MTKNSMKIINAVAMTFIMERAKKRARFDGMTKAEQKKLDTELEGYAKSLKDMIQLCKEYAQNNRNDYPNVSSLSAPVNYVWQYWKDEWKDIALCAVDRTKHKWVVREGRTSGLVNLIGHNDEWSAIISEAHYWHGVYDEEYNLDRQA